MMAEALLLNHHEPARRRGVSSTMAHAVAVSKVLRAAVVFACGPTAVLAQAAPPDTSKAPLSGRPFPIEPARPYD
jgi:hypothetical protein